MEVTVNAIHFEASAALEAFINKKAEKVQRRYPNVIAYDFTLKVVKPETSLNKEVTVKVSVPKEPEIVATKVADTFEEAVDVSLEAIERQLERKKNGCSGHCG